MAIMSYNRNFRSKSGFFDFLSLVQDLSYANLSPRKDGGCQPLIVHRNRASTTRVLFILSVMTVTRPTGVSP